MSDVLRLRGVEVVYNKHATAISGISLEVRPGQLVAILGTNGAGKTTTLKAIAGFVGADRADITNGSVIFDGAEITGLAPHKAAAKGLAFVPEREKIFEAMTVLENLAIAPGVGRGHTEEVLSWFPALADVGERRAGLLSGGQRQMLAVGMAMATRPRLLMIDELSQGLAPVVVSQLLDDLDRLRRESGTSVLLVEQNAAAALRRADYAYVLEDGKVVADGSPDRLLSHDDIREFYLGLSEVGTGRSYREVRQYRRRRRWWA